MKVPLRYQITEIDCGPTSVQNAISYLFDREEIPAIFIKAISVYTLDCYDKKGNLGQGGTSIDAMRMLYRWLMIYSKKNSFDLHCEYYRNKEVTLSKISNCLKENGCVVLRTFLDVDHYVLITRMDEEYVYIFDPYNLEDDYYEDDVEIIDNKPFEYNRKVGIERFKSVSRTKNFALGSVDRRECLLLNRKINS